MPEIDFLCLAVSRRDGGNCIAGIDAATGQWIRPVNPKRSGALADHEIVVSEGAKHIHRIMAPLDFLSLPVSRQAGTPIHPENWEIDLTKDGGLYTFTKRFRATQDLELLISCLDKNDTLLHSYGASVPESQSKVRPLTHSLSLIRPERLYWRVNENPKYATRLQIRADFLFNEIPYLLVVTDPLWETRCKRLGVGRHPHAAVADSNTQVFLTVSLAGVPLHGYHYKLVAGVIQVPIPSAS